MKSIVGLDNHSVGTTSAGHLLRWRAFASLAASALRIVLTTLVLALIIFRAGAGAPATNHFSFLANAFLHGTFSVGPLPDSYADWIAVGDQVYLPMGPAPAMLLMPFVALFGITFDELWLSLLVTLLNFWVLRMILRRIGIDDAAKQKWLLALFFVGTIYLAALILGRSWFLAHLCATLFLLLAINETLRGGSMLLTGLLLGLAFLTRQTTVFALPFFLLLLGPDPQQVSTGPEEGAGVRAWTRHLASRAFLTRALALGAGLGVPLLFFFYYNYARFGNILDTGYARAVPGAAVLREAMSYGLFSLAHVPKNLYMLFLAPPQPVPSSQSPVLQFPWILPSRWGMGILFTTPAFVYALWADRSRRLVQAAWFAVLAILPFLLTYYGVGFDQFGYRYAMDFYPFLFILTALGIVSRFNSTAKVWMIISILVNIWGAWCVLFGWHV